MGNDDLEGNIEGQLQNIISTKSKDKKFEGDLECTSSINGTSIKITGVVLVEFCKLCKLCTVQGNQVGFQWREKKCRQ